MTHSELNARLSEAGVAPRDFIRWAATKGVKVPDSTVSRHRSGKQKITAPWALAYLWFFETSNPASSPLAKFVGMAKDWPWKEEGDPDK